MKTQDSSTFGYILLPVWDIHLILLTNLKLLLERHVVSVAKRVISVEFVDNLQSLGGQKSASPYVSYIVADLVSSDDDFCFGSRSTDPRHIPD